MPGRICGTEKTTKGGRREATPVGGGLIDELAPGHGLITFI